MLRNRLVIAGLVLLLAAPAAFAAMTEQEVEQEHSLVTQLVTPHKKWAKGYVGGPVRALFIVKAAGYGAGSWYPVDTHLREVVELGQRFDLRPEAILVGNKGEPSDFLGEAMGYRRAERVLKQEYDVYVFAGFPIQSLPPKMQYVILEKVAKGAGLVLCGPGSSDYLLPKRKMDPPPSLTDGLPALDGKPARSVLSTYRLREGRAAWLNYNAWTLVPTAPFSWRGLNEYDYRMMVVGRAVLWAARRDGDVSVVSALGAKEGPVTRTQAGLEDAVTLANRGTKPVQAKVALEVRRASDGWRQDLGQSTVAVQPGQEAKVSYRLPRLRADDYFVDAVVTSSRGVEAFGAGSLTLSSDYGVDRVEMEGSFIERGEAISCKALLRGTPPAGSVLRLRFRDSWGRVLDQRDTPVDGRTEYGFEFTPGASATIQMRVEAALLAGGDEVQMKDTSFTVPKRARGQFNFLQWDTPNDVLGYYAWRKMRDEAGQNLCLLGSFGESRAVPVLQACDIPIVPYSTRILDPRDDNGFMKPCCWNDEPNVTAHVQKIVDNQKKHREHGVFVYSLGDEGVTMGACVHPACIAAYRRYLQEQYGTLEKLNASWNATYKTWDEMDLLDHKDSMESGALARGLSARWYDRQAFARYNLMQFSGRFVDAYKKLDPQGITGFEGTGGFGDDYDAILGINTFYSPYPSIGDDINRSAAPRQIIRANWMGYSKTGDALSDAAWRMVIKGMDSIWYWMWTGSGSWIGYLTPTLDFSPAIADLTNEMRPVRAGLGDLLLQSKMTHPGIGVFYSVASALSHEAERGHEFLRAESAHDTWTRLTYDLGLDFRYLTSGMVKRGALTNKEFKVLLLPVSQAIAPEEAEAIRAFVRAGGTVIADVRPGIYDGHCKPLETGALDDVFGIKRTGRPKAERSAIAVKASLGETPVAFEAPLARVDAGVQAGTAQALAQAGQRPLLLVNRFGAGRAILLNFQMLSEKPDDAQAASARALLAGLYAAAGVKPLLTATDPKGGPLPMTETRVWQNGDALVFGMWRKMQCEWFSPKAGTEAGEPVAARITLPAPRHVYDLRTGKYLGNVTQVSSTLRWGRANFFLALPYRVDGVDVRLPARTPAAGQILDAEIRLRVPAGAKEKHVVLVEVLDPKGEKPGWGRQVLVLNGGAGTVSLPVAFNDAGGKWRVRATELFSGKAGEVAWTVR